MDGFAEHLTRQGLRGTMSVRFWPEPGRIAMPDACCDLIWREERVFLSGPSSRGHAIGADGGEVQLVNLDASALRRLLAMPMRDLADTTVPLADVLPALEGMCAELFFQGRAGELVAPGRPALSADPRVDYAALAISRGRSVRGAAAEIGTSERQLERLFDDVVGMTPRRYRRVVRLRQAIEFAKSGETLAGAASLAGYADQPHFTREAQALTGMSPRGLLPNVGKLQDSDVRIRDY